MVNQYRPALRMRLDELPAGLLDVDGEPALDAAQRELAEEASRAGADWSVLLDLHTSPGFSDEAIRIYLARGLSDVEPAGRVRRRARGEFDVGDAGSARRRRAARAGRRDHQRGGGGRDPCRGARARRPAGRGCGRPTRRGPDVPADDGNRPARCAPARAGAARARLSRSSGRRARRRGQHAVVLPARPRPLRRLSRGRRMCARSPTSMRCR